MITDAHVTGGVLGPAIVRIDRSRRLADLTQVYASELTSLDARQCPVAVKVDDGHQRGNRLAVERAAYEALTASSLASKTLTYFGAGHAPWGDGASVEVLALERAKASLDQFYAAPDRTRVALAVAGLRESVEFLVELDAQRRRSDGVGLPFAHRDIKPGNWFLVEREGAFTVVLGDFGYARGPESGGDHLPEGTLAPEQRRVGGRRAALPTVRTDLWGAGLAAWILLHGGAAPYVEADSARWLQEGIDPFGDQIRLELTAPSTVDLKRVPTGPHAAQALAHSVALLQAEDGADRLVRARELLPRLRALAEEVGPLTATELEPFLRVVTPPAQPLSPSVRGLLDLDPLSVGPHPAETASAVRSPGRAREFTRRIAVGFSGSTRSIGRGIRDALSALRGLPLALAVVVVVSGVALVLGWTQLMPIPDASVDRLQQWIATALLTTLGLTLLIVSVAARAATPYDDRAPHPWLWPLITGVLTVGSLAALTTWGMAFPVRTSGVALWGAAGLAAAGIHARLSRALARHRRKTSRPKLFVAMTAPVVTIVALVALLVPVATPVAAAVSSHVAGAEAVAFVPGIPSGVPVLLKPHAIAVSAEGDVAVVDRVGVNRDVIWIVPDDHAQLPFAVMRTLSWSGEDNEAALSAVPPPVLTDAQDTLMEWVYGSNPAVRSVDSIDFVDEDTLVLLGIDGITLLDFSTQADGSVASTVTRVSDELRSIGGDGRFGKIVAIGDTAYVTTATPAIALEGDPPTVDFCEYDTDFEQELWSVALVADATVEPVMRELEDGTLCADDVETIYREGDVLNQIVNRPTGVADVWDNLIVKDGRLPTDAPLLDREGSTSVIRHAASDGGRLLINRAFCMLERSIDGTRPDTQTVQMRTTGEPALACGGIFPVAAADDVGCLDRAGRTPLITSTAYWQPLTSGGPDGAIYTSAPIAETCTASILKLMPGEDQWLPIGSVDIQPPQVDGYALGETATMSAARPAFVDDSVSWHVPAFGQVTTGRSGTRTTGLWKFKLTSNAPFEILHSRDLPAEGDLLPLVATRFEMGTEEEATSLAISGDRGGERVSMSIPIEGLTDIEAIDERLFYSRCGQIASIDTNVLLTLLRTHGASGSGPTVTLENAPKEESPGTSASNGAAETADEAAVDADGTQLSVVAKVSVGLPDVNHPCVPPERSPVAFDYPLVDSDVDIAPLAFEIKGDESNGYRILFAEAGLFGDDRASRVRMADTAADTIATVGYDPEDPRHRNEVNEPTGDLLAGDLLSRGLVATDVALRSDGHIAISTATARGTGPLLLIVGNRTIAVDAGDREVTGVAWANSELIITDGARGDVVVLDVTEALAQAAPPLVSLFGWILTSPAHGVRAP